MAQNKPECCASLKTLEEDGHDRTTPPSQRPFQGRASFRGGGFGAGVALEKDFTHTDSAGPMLAQNFYYGNSVDNAVSMRLREDFVTIAQALINA